MVSFSCEACGDVLTKKKLDPHRNRCHGATFTCIDCMVHFPGLQYRSHTSCMTEDQKYQGALYKDKSKKQKGNNYDANSINNNNNNNFNNNFGNNNNNNNNNKNNFGNNGNNNNPSQYQTTDNDETMAHNAYVEDCGEDREFEWADYEGHSDDNGSPSEPPPEAPTPPPAAHEEHVDVFEFLVAASAGQTPNASKLNLADADAQSTSLVRYEPPKSEELPDPAAFLDENGQLVEFAPKPQPPPEFVTPAPKHSRRKSREGSEKKDKKRKRLHVEVPDQEMTDAPPMLHTGLTGGLNRMMRPIFPPSPDYSGGDAPEASPASPLKKTKHSKSKHSKHTKNGQVTNSIFGMLASSKAKSKVKSKSSSKSSSKSKSKTSSSSSKKHSSKEKKTPQLIEFRPQSKDGQEPNEENQVILFKPRADVFLGFVDKGPTSEKGCSMNKVLKRFHKERQASGSELGKGVEEKELWRSLRLRQNDRGEVVLFSVE